MVAKLLVEGIELLARGSAHHTRHAYFFFFNDTATIEIYTSVHTLSLHDALPIWYWVLIQTTDALGDRVLNGTFEQRSEEHTSELQSRTLISYAVFCLKKKKR